MPKTDHDILIEIHTVLLGTDSDPGLVGKVEKQAKCLSKLKSHIYVMIGLLAGLGIIQGWSWLS